MTEPIVIQRRTHRPEAAARLTQDGLPPLLARLYAARGIQSRDDLPVELGALIPANRLHNVEQMARLLADAIAAGKRLLIIADYDSDGATACAVGLRALRAFGARVDYLVPNRFEYGYGLTPEIVQLAADIKKPDVLITVDNGIASVEGVATANQLGMRVLITDHHLPGAQLPDAWCIVNPNQHGCGFPSKNLAGVGVMFYLMLALRAELRGRGAFARGPEPNLAALLDLVALGTVADVVKLDGNNRLLVSQGLNRIRAGKTWPGIAALLRVAGREAKRASTYDLGFVLGPRLNAAGRLDDMSVGIECLITNDVASAQRLAQQLDSLNRERRVIESDMQEQATALLERLAPADNYSLCLFDPDWHQGVVGILASRIKDRWHRPVIAFARGGNGEIKGSGRSIPSLHLRDALDRVAKQSPGLLLRFGGHAAAAGVALRESDFPRFAELFEANARELLVPADLKRLIESDGPLASHELTMDSARLIEQQVWGQGFAQPLFDDTFVVTQQRVVAGRHLKMRLLKDDTEYEAMLFSHALPMPAHAHMAYRIAVNEFNGRQTLQLTIEHWQARE